MPNSRETPKLSVRRARSGCGLNVGPDSCLRSEKRRSRAGVTNTRKCRVIRHIQSRCRRLASPVISPPTGRRWPKFPTTNSRAVAEAAETLFARAKDVEGLFAAVETKLTEMRKYILWRDGLGLNGG